MTRRTTPPVVVSSVIERAGREVLICRVDAGLEHVWEFPSGPACAGESPEAAIRRVVVETVGIAIDILIGQPPLAGCFRGRDVVFRYFLAGYVSGDARALAYSEVRWVLRGALREYDYDPTTQPIVTWYLESDR